MRTANIWSFVFLIMVASMLSMVGIDLTSKIPLLSTPEGFGIDAEQTNEIIRSTGLWFWMPITDFIWCLANLLVPATIGVSVVSFAERKLFARQATMQLTVAPIWLAVAVAIAYFGCPTIPQLVFVYGSVALVGAYSLFYQLNGTRKKSSSPSQAAA